MWQQISSEVGSGSGGFPTALVVLATNVVILVGLFVRQGRQGQQVEQINKAVNHQSVDEDGNEKPTLIQRMVTVEKRTEEMAEETSRHRDWVETAFASFANHVGLSLPRRDDPDHVPSKS